MGAVRKAPLGSVLIGCCVLCLATNFVDSANLNSFVLHKTVEQVAEDRRMAEAEASLVKLREESEAQSKLRIPKVALLFLTRGDMPHEAAWAAWLGAARGLVPMEFLEPGACSWNGSLQQPAALDRPALDTYRLRRRIFVEQALFSIYLHPSPEFPGYPKDSVFYGHSVRLRVKVSWGSHSEVEAMRLLLRAALVNPLNQHFVFLCETSIPIYPPTVIYLQILKEGKSKIDACPKDDPEHPANSINRWQPGMLPVIPRELWRKSGQWITLTRKHADLVTRDYAVASEFEEHCEAEANEHYFGVLLAVHKVENETTCTSNTVSCVWPWENGKFEQWPGEDCCGDLSHPVTFQADQITPSLILERRQNKPDWNKRPVCRDSDAIKSANSAFVAVGRDWNVGCHWKAESAYDTDHLAARQCSLFARKMSTFAKLQVEEVITSCDKRLQIAPRHPCRRDRENKTGWLLWS